MNNPAGVPMYAFSNPQAGNMNPIAMSPGPPFDTAAQTPFQPGTQPGVGPNLNHMQRPAHPQQIPPHASQQHLYRQQPGQGVPPRPGSAVLQGTPNEGHYPNGQTTLPMTQAPNQPFHHPQLQMPTNVPQSQPTTSAPLDMNIAPNMAVQNQQNASLAQQAQMQHAAQMTRPVAAQHHPQQAAGPSLSPQSAARERARVSVLLEINTHLLQEVISLQSQGKAGTVPSSGQQSPTSPTSADPGNTLTNSPGEPPKSAGGGGATANKPPSQEYADCMRRLQANLAYLAAIADAKKKVGALPTGPAIMVPPPHLPQVHDLYKKLNALFPEAGQSAASKAAAYGAAQNQNPHAGAKPAQAASVSAHG
ncbi:hypothetical protein HRR84_006036 [Exophiala dermatitidis]|nr:hypothetical protein HRR73_004982 [Exophiala dermatitidis]KAJ4594762.1 hypothetical protein HRR84_006036 [Exophiala dermatitidis]